MENDLATMNNIHDEIISIKKQMGQKLVILGHHYQRPSVLQYADEIGDSLELSRKVITKDKAEKIVFCGVRFMAESAAILAKSNQIVYMPDITAGCPMANMADVPSFVKAMTFLKESWWGEWVPVLYVNSSAELKGICGSMGGITCTSSNAIKVINWVLMSGKKVLFLPDEHLGRNTAYAMGIKENEIVVYDPLQENGGLTQISNAQNIKMILWKGFCIVHKKFTINDVLHARNKFPDAKIIVHPEVPAEVAKLCDARGSTAQIIKYVEGAQNGSTVIIGTEINLVARLAEIHKGRINVFALNQSACANMAKTNEENLLFTLKNWPSEHEIHVPQNIAVNAKLALDRMLSL